MHATVFTYPLPPEHLENLAAGIKQNTRRPPDTPGFQHGYWIYDRERSTVYAVVVFDSAEQAQAAWEEAGPSVTEGFKMMGITQILAGAKLSITSNHALLTAGYSPSFLTTSCRLATTTDRRRSPTHGRRHLYTWTGRCSRRELDWESPLPSALFAALVDARRAVFLCAIY